MSLDRLARDLSQTRGPILVVTGAGISLASGIPTFRGSDKDAVWKRDITELGTFHYFCMDPVGSWRWYLSRFAALDRAAPNDGHRALVELERRCQANGISFLLVTQNIDSLHRRAGSTQLVEVHGSAAHARCSRDGCELGAPDGTVPREQVDLARFLDEPTATNLPRCPRCGSVLRPHVLWFDEYYTSHTSYQWSRVLQASEAAEWVLFVGTSFAVGVTEQVLSTALARKRPVYSIDPAGTDIPGVIEVTLPAESALVDLLPLLGW